MSELIRLLRGDFGDGETIEALVAQVRAAGTEAAVMIRDRLSGDEATRKAGQEAWDKARNALPEPPPLSEEKREKLGEVLTRLNTVLADVVEQSRGGKPTASS